MNYMKDKNYGIIYYTYGNKFPPDLQKSVNSVRQWNKYLKIAWITEIPNHPKKNIFDVVIESKSNKKYGWHKRTESLLLTPFDVTLHLDSDTVILGNLSYGFEKAEKFNIALCHAPAYYGGTFCTNPAKNIYPLHKEQIVYNAGVIFYKKSEMTWEVINKWIEYNDNYNVAQDQVGLSNSFEKLDFNPFVLSRSWNFRGGLQSDGHGPMKIWHSHKNVPQNKIKQKGFFRL